MASDPSGFSSLPLRPAAREALARLGYLTPTSIQEAALKDALAGRDLIARAETGSGKTLVFSLALLDKLNLRRFAVQALVLCPTRELAEQVAGEIRRLASAERNTKVVVLSGGVPIRGQAANLEHGAHVAVGTPGRVLDHLERGSLRLDALETLVLDEADRMLDMGFVDDIVRVAEACPADRQTLLFSATYPAPIGELAARLLRDPLRIAAEDRRPAGAVDERAFPLGADGRYEAASLLLRAFRPERTIAFCNTRARCRELTAYLRDRRFSALELHGELEQWEREQALARFAGKGVSVLVATDVASRGLDIEKLEAVLNVDLPPDPEVYEHRIGRTARAGETGLALSLYAEEEEVLLERIEAFRGKATPRADLASLERDGAPPLPPMGILVVYGGKRDKLRPGDILGALTGEAGFSKESVGKIQIAETVSFVAVARAEAEKAARALDAGRIKGKTFRVRALES